ncbi:H(+)/Cl(-) exchange transporter ClcA [Legionella erythra]|uniref:Voltage-gated chloride channel protein (ClC-type) n=1 Tax=Legionella erythra TaxID=448 RepID=A0A0W0TR70_LEGER|nr:H(+)/Cl(-) exchange transporter ClcA [Legionella erythra]KTC97963.1 voltage-gated chloride channel protein (ClC-type) [Legionella erythra]
MKSKVLKIYAVAILLGILTGIIGSYFQIAITYLSRLLSMIINGSEHLGIPGALTSMMLSMLLVYLAWLMVKKIAPEASGSGVQEIEGALLHERKIFWQRLLPVKFIAGVMSISASMVVGREGPTIQMGGNLGEMLGQWLRIPRRRRDTLIAAGAASGLATAFNAPLAGVLFVIEEMRNQFNFTFTNFKMVAIACVMATIVSHWLVGAGPAIAMSVFALPSLKSLWLFFIFGLLAGLAGLVFNLVLMKSLSLKDRLSDVAQGIYALILGAVVGLLAYWYSPIVGGGYEIIHQSLTLSPPANVLLLLIGLRFVMTMLCYSSSVPGGIFAPMLALGTLFGLASYYVLILIMPDTTIHPGMFAVAGMGALFSAAVRSPLTGIVLVVEMTQNYLLILPMMVTCLTSTTVVQLAKNPPIYAQLLKRTLTLARAPTLRG